MSNRLLKTAFGTARELAEYSDIPNAKKMWELLGGDAKHFQTSKKVSGMPWSVELRYKASETIIKNIRNKEGIKQTIEMASGFTPHALNLLGKKVLNNYIESDFDANIKRKKFINNVLGNGLNIQYVSGNLFSKITWNKIESKLNPGKVIIFSEGFIVYTTKQERNELSELIKPLLKKRGGYFVFEDSIRFQADFLKNKNFNLFFKKLSIVNGKKLNLISQEEMIAEWMSRGFKVEREAIKNIRLKSESLRPEFVDDVKLLKKNYRMWKLSLM